MRRTALIAILGLLGLGALSHAQYFEPIQAPQYWWTDLGNDELALWKDGVQVGNLDMDTGTYRPRFGPGRWGVPIDPPVKIPTQYAQRAKTRKRNWRESGVMGPGGESNIPNSGLHLRKTPKKGRSPAKPHIKSMGTSIGALEQGSTQIPNYQDQGSITFVSNDGSLAYQAEAAFNDLPELAAARQKYQRVKSYSLEDFNATSSAFKLDRDRIYAKTGFVALAQEKPDNNDRAKVKSIYEFSNGQQFAGALRDADDSYDPNDSSIPGSDPTEWSSFQAVVGTGLMMMTGCCLFGAIRLRARHVLVI